MRWKVLKTEEDYNAASSRLMEIFHAESDTHEGNEMELLILLVKDYDERHYPLPQVKFEKQAKNKMSI